MNIQEEGRTNAELESYATTFIVGELAADLQVGTEGIPEDILRTASSVLGINPDTYPVNTTSQILDSFIAGGFWMNDAFVRERGTNMLANSAQHFLALYTSDFNPATALYLPRCEINLGGEIIIAGAVGVQLDELVLRARKIERESGNESMLKQERDLSHLAGVHEFAHMGYFVRLPEENGIDMASFLGLQTQTDLYYAQHHEFHALRWQLRAAQALGMDPRIVDLIQERIRKAEQIRASE